MSDTEIQTWSPSHGDIMRAFRKATEVIQSVATPDAVYDASVAMTGETSKDAGYRAYYLTLFGAADSDGQSAARDAFDSALAESAKRHAQREAERIAAQAGYDAEDTSDNADDLDSLV